MKTGNLHFWSACIVIIAIALLIYAYAAVKYYSFDDRKQPINIARIHARHICKIVSAIIDDNRYLLEDSKLLDTDCTMLFYRIAETSRNDRILLELDSRWSENGIFIDPYGMPYKIILSQITNNSNDENNEHEIVIKVWSRGPNKRDDNGQADDIYYFKVYFENRTTHTNHSTSSAK